MTVVSCLEAKSVVWIYLPQSEQGLLHRQIHRSAPIARSRSFTSGCERKDKVVLGHHFSLTKYLSWMAETFQLNSESRFILLSGIAHDIPCKEISSHLHKPTVTHLTPAMGQILVGGQQRNFHRWIGAFLSATCSQRGIAGVCRNLLSTPP